MPIELRQTDSGRIITVLASGTLTKEDYERFVPAVENMIREHGKIRVLFEMHDFHGWEVAALWEDLKFELKHFSDVERLAMVGERKWEKGMAVFCQPFTTAESRYFDSSEVDLAKQWVESK